MHDLPKLPQHMRDGIIRASCMGEKPFSVFSTFMIKEQPSSRYLPPHSVSPVASRGLVTLFSWATSSDSGIVEMAGSCLSHPWHCSLWAEVEDCLIWGCQCQGHSSAWLLRGHTSSWQPRALYMACQGLRLAAYGQKRYCVH